MVSYCSTSIGKHVKPVHKIDFPLSIKGKFNNIQIDFPYTEIELNDTTQQLYLLKTNSQPHDVIFGEILKMEDGQVLVRVYEKNTQSFGLLRLVHFTPRMEFEVALLKNETTQTGLNLISHGMINRNMIFDAYFASSFTSKDPIAYFLYDGYWSDTLEGQLNNRRLNERGLYMFVTEDALRRFEQRTVKLRVGVSEEERIVNPLCLPSNILVKTNEVQEVTEMVCFNYSLAFHPDEWQFIPPEVLKSMISLIVGERYVLTEVTELLATTQGVNFNTLEGFPDFVFINIVRYALSIMVPQPLLPSGQIIIPEKMSFQPVNFMTDLSETNQISLPKFDRDLSPRQSDLTVMETIQNDMARRNRYKSHQQRADFVKKRKFLAIEKAKIVQVQCQKILDAERVDHLIQLQKENEKLKQQFDDEQRIQKELRKKEKRRLKEETEKAKRKEEENRVRLETIENNARKQRALIVMEPQLRRRQVQQLLAQDNRKTENTRRSNQYTIIEHKASEIQKLQNLVTREYAMPRETPLPDSKRKDIENRAPWEFRRYVKDMENPF